MDQDQADDFARRFADFWADPDPQRLHLLLADDVRLSAPLTVPSEGLPAAIETFEGLFAYIPDLRATVHRWGPHPDGRFIDFSLHGTVGDRQVMWRAVDVFEVGADGLATARDSYFDPAPLLAG